MVGDALGERLRLPIIGVVLGGETTLASLEFRIGVDWSTCVNGSAQGRIRNGVISFDTSEPAGA